MEELSHLEKKMNSGENEKMFSRAKSSVSISEIKELQTNFLQQEVWMLTFGASFQRANAYVNGASEETKVHFKTKTAGFIDNMLSVYQEGNVLDQDHIRNIKSVCEFSSGFSEIFVGGRINFGIAQKMLNLYLKYQWCLGNIPAPPHFPVDRIIQQKLIKTARKNKIATIPLEAWTQFKDETHYLIVVNLSREVAKVDRLLENLTPAEVELKLFERR